MLEKKIEEVFKSIDLTNTNDAIRDISLMDFLSNFSLGSSHISHNINNIVNIEGIKTGSNQPDNNINQFIR